MDYEPIQDRKGQTIRPGDRVKVRRKNKVGKWSVIEGVVEVSKRATVKMRGELYKQLLLKTDDGTLYSFPDGRNVTKAEVSMSSKAQVIARLVEAGHSDLAEQLVAEASDYEKKRGEVQSALPKIPKNLREFQYNFSSLLSDVQTYMRGAARADIISEQDESAANIHLTKVSKWVVGLK